MVLGVFMFPAATVLSPLSLSSPPLLSLSLVEQSKQYTYELDLDTLEWTKLPNGQGAEREHQNHW